MAGMGPPPKDPSQRRRTNATLPMTAIPAEGRKGRTPPWPLPPSDSRADAEAKLWSELWRMPQAVLWEKQRISRVVAQYVRWKVLAEQGSLDAGREARQYEDRLLLSPLALVRARVEVVATEPEKKAPVVESTDNVRHLFAAG